MSKILPAIIPESLTHLKETLAFIETFTRTVQIDIVDGKFVPFVSWPYHAGDQLEDMRAIVDAFSVEVDLMIDAPETVIPHYVEMGVQRIVVHLESTNNITEILAHYHAHDYELGLSIENSTPLETLTAYIDEIDFVQLMGIAHIGSQGQPFDERVLDRITEVRERYPTCPISIDGSVNGETIPRLHAAGADRFISGSALLGATDPQATFASFQEMVL